MKNQQNSKKVRISNKTVTIVCGAAGSAGSGGGSSTTDGSASIGTKHDTGKPYGWTVLMGFLPVLLNFYKLDDRKWLRICEGGIAIALDLMEECSQDLTPEIVWEQTTLLKVIHSVLDYRGLAGVLENGTFGAKKYGRFNFLQVENAVERYREAGGRHLVRWLDGEDIDPESQVDHLDMWLWNMIAEYRFLREE